MYLIRKINAITAKVFGIIFSISNVVKSIYTDDESKSKNDMNNIINVEYIRTKVQITFNTMTNFFFDILIRFLCPMLTDTLKCWST